MKIKLVTRAQEAEESKRLLKETQATADRIKLIGRMAIALKHAHDYLDPLTRAPGITRDDLLTEIKSLLLRQ
jgi:hypothetical protein